MKVFVVLACALLLLGCDSEGKPVLAPHPIRLQAVPPSADIVFHRGGDLFVMRADGKDVRQITFDLHRNWEHAAVSFDRRYIVANEQMPGDGAEPGGHSRLWLYDLKDGLEIPLLRNFVTAGNGGVDWSPDGVMYFAAKFQNVFPTPGSAEEFRANAGANDIYRLRPGGVPERVLVTPNLGEADVSVSQDGGMIAFVSQPLDSDHNEIWVARSDGTVPRRVYRAGKSGVASAHDPELSPDNAALVFSVVNSKVAPNFPDRPGANTAHDVYRVNIDTARLQRLTAPGSISIIPDWLGTRVIYTEINDHTTFQNQAFYIGTSIVDDTAENQVPTRVQLGAGSSKWIPRVGQ